MSEQKTYTTQVLDAVAAAGQVAWDNATLSNLKTVVAVASVIPNPAMPLARALTIAGVVIAMSEKLAEEKAKEVKEEIQ